MLNLEKVLISAGLDTLINDIISVAQEKIDVYKHQQTCIILSGEDIIFK